MKKIIYTVNALFAIFSLAYLLPLIKTISLLDFLNSGIFGYALVAEIFIAVVVIIMGGMVLANRLNSSKLLDIFSILFLFFGLFNLIPRLMRISYYINDLFCAGKIASVCTGNGIIAVLSNASIATTVYAQFIFLILIVAGLYMTFKKKTV